MIDVSGQVVLITGGSRGIGASVAELFSKAGANVVITYANNVKAATKVCRLIKENGGKTMALCVRVQDRTSCRRGVEQVLKKYGRIDILVNNAGIWEFGEVKSMPLRTWQKTIDINLSGTFNMCQSVIPTMISQKYGRIINIASTAGQRGEADHSHYAASKGGIIAFTKSIAVELMPLGIWVNCVAPGWVETDMTQHVFSNPTERKGIERSIPRGRAATANEVAGPVLFLASSLADHIVGEVINVNGGSVLYG